MAPRPLFPGRSFAGFLFDMDGTILTSILAAERVWGRWARRHGLDVEAFLPTMHGRRGIETIADLNLPGVDPAAEAAWVLAAELEDVEGIEAIAGASAFLATLPRERWAIVTSSPRSLAERRLGVAGLPLPGVIVTGEDVVNGKPAPDCFVLGARRLGFGAEDCLVFEDGAAGIAAGRAAGSSVLVITATHSGPQALEHPGVAHYSDLSVEVQPDGRLTLLSGN